MSEKNVEDFWEFIHQNPVCMELVDKYTRVPIDRGFQHYGISPVIERVRWHTDVEFISDDGFKINNNHRAYIARLWMNRNPEYEGFFRIRGDRNSLYLPEVKELL